jgi:hypothetical protein
LKPTSLEQANPSFEGVQFVFRQENYKLVAAAAICLCPTFISYLLNQPSYRAYGCIACLMTQPLVESFESIKISEYHDVWIPFADSNQ